MPDFSLTEAAFEGFRFTRERPGSVAAWALATFGFNLATGVLGALVGGDALRAFQAAARSSNDVSQMLPLLLPAVPALVVTVLMELAGASVVYASALRCFMGIDRKVSFRLGGDERRLFLLLVGYGVFYWLFTVITGVLFGLAENIAQALSPAAANFLIFVAPIAMFCLPIFVIVRLSLAPVIAVDRKRINLKESWVSTKGHFWPLAGSLVLSIGLFLVVVFVALMLVMILTELASIGTHGAIAKPGDLFSPDATVGPALVFGEIVTAICIALLLPVLLGPLVRAYQAYDAPDPTADPRLQA
jgi:hypothetical protein